MRIARIQISQAFLFELLKFPTGARLASPCNEAGDLELTIEHSELDDVASGPGPLIRPKYRYDFGKQDEKPGEFTRDKRVEPVFVDWGKP